MTSIMTLATIAGDALAEIRGGEQRGQSRAQKSERYQNECLSKDARQHYDIMVQRMVPNSSEAPGFKRRVVESVASLCHWPAPK
jgi:hypothetical protein